MKAHECRRTPMSACCRLVMLISCRTLYKLQLLFWYIYSGGCSNRAAVFTRARLYIHALRLQSAVGLIRRSRPLGINMEIQYVAERCGHCKLFRGFIIIREDFIASMGVNHVYGHEKTQPAALLAIHFH